MIRRFEENPLITPADVRPSHPGLEVIGALNPGATLFEGETLLLVRVAERPIQEAGYVSTIVAVPDRPGEIQTVRVKLDDPDLVYKDPRVFYYKGQAFLTSLSHLRLARSKDGRNFKVAEKPTMVADGIEEQYGVEDARVVRMPDGWYYVNTASASTLGITMRLARTKDFASFERLGTIFTPDNKDTAFFPEKIGGRYYAFHRPCNAVSTMWVASSTDMLDWGRHRPLMGPRPGLWDGERVGCGAEPIRTAKGWLQLYHGAIVTPDGGVCYGIGAVMLDGEKPWVVVKRLEEAVALPEASYETDGFVSRVIFHNGLVRRSEGEVDLYYGAADERTCGMRLDLEALMRRF